MSKQHLGKKYCYLHEKVDNLTKFEIKLIYIVKLSQEIKKVELNEVAVY